MTDFKVPDSFYESLKSTYSKAVESGDLVFTPTSTIYTNVDDVSYVYSVIPTLKQKPQGIPKPSEEEQEEEQEDSSAPFDPFDPPSPPLLVLPDYANNYAVVLNKFAVVPYHFILITKDKKPQSAPLEPTDLHAAYSLLRATNKQSGIRHVGFFNCGANSGASIDHRHIQFIEFPNPKSSDGAVYEPWPDVIVKPHSTTYKNGQKPISAHHAPFFSHFLAPIDTSTKEDELADHLSFRYSTLLSRVLTSLRHSSLPPRSPISYNLVFTEEWMLAVPRTAPDFIDAEADIKIGVNAVGAIGLILAKGDDELEYIKKKGPVAILQGVSLESQKREEDVDYDY
ncbi:uncharacterized protein SAPINGB_P005025 [Magnusiomyces paraingens]|uniref:Uncharacterized protein n=1 Tax=Magnusiomyces paraingens TaxID=2606893 RepID=A0A5E8C331_9ASCO|nr:uncharacterized protein SAPINGB_P005025 [Saprochaete ingens]VVT56381.1 unnamed protein product [Saprochaete ingens]